MNGLFKYAKSKNWVFAAHDQGLILDYYRHNMTLLDDALNWKPVSFGNNHIRVYLME